MPAIATQILEFVLTIGFALFIHELGHFLSARIFGVRVQRFSVFLSPFFYLIVWKPGRHLRLFVSNREKRLMEEEEIACDLQHFEEIRPRSWKDTEYTLGWIPIAGYCLYNICFQRNDPTTNETIYPYWDIRNAKPWKRLIITLSGVTANIILAVLLFFSLFLYKNSQPIESSDFIFVEYSPYALQAGLKNEDRIISADTIEIGSSVVSAIAHRDDIIGSSTVKVVRGNDTLTLSLPAHFKEGIEKEVVRGDFGMPLFRHNTRPIVKAVIPQSGDESTGIRSGDMLLSVNGITITTIEAYVNLLGWWWDKDQTDVGVIRANLDKQCWDTLHFTMEMLKKDKYVLANSKEEAENTLDSLIKAGRHSSLSMTAEATYGVASAIASGYTDNPQDVVTDSGGILSLIQELPDTWDWLNIIYITAIISIGIAIFNLIPFPGLDGGQAIFSILEILLRRRLNENILGWINGIGWLLLLIWIAYSNVKDVFKLFH